MSKTRKQPPNLLHFPDPLKRDFKNLPFTEDQLQEALIYQNIMARLAPGREKKDDPETIMLVSRITEKVLSRKAEFEAGGSDAIIIEEIVKAVGPDWEELRIMDRVEERLFGPKKGKNGDE